MKVGDKVFVFKDPKSTPSVSVIERETKTSWVVGKSLYLKDSRRLRCGDVWCRRCIAEFNEEKEEEYRIRRLIERIRWEVEQCKLYKLSDDQVKTIAEIMVVDGE